MIRFLLQEHLEQEMGKNKVHPGSQQEGQAAQPKITARKAAKMVTREKRTLWEQAAAALDAAVAKEEEVRSGTTFSDARELVKGREEALPPAQPGSASLVAWRLLAEGTMATAERKFREAAKHFKECAALLDDEEVAFLELAARCDEISASRQIPQAMAQLIGDDTRVSLLIQYGPPAGWLAAVA